MRYLKKDPFSFGWSKKYGKGYEEIFKEEVPKKKEEKTECPKRCIHPTKPT